MESEPAFFSETRSCSAGGESEASTEGLFSATPRISGSQDARFPIRLPCSSICSRALALKSLVKWFTTSYNIGTLHTAIARKGLPGEETPSVEFPCIPFNCGPLCRFSCCFNLMSGYGIPVVVSELGMR